jgi:hypothetical protein
MTLAFFVVRFIRSLLLPSLYCLSHHICCFAVVSRVALSDIIYFHVGVFVFSSPWE